MGEDKTTTTMDTVIIRTTRIRELADFYQKGLQLEKPVPYGDDHLGIQLPGTYLGFDQAEEDRSRHHGAVSLWFRVDDIEDTFQRFNEMGAKVNYPPTKKPFGDILASVLDPDGNIVGLAQR